MKRPLERVHLLNEAVVACRQRDSIIHASVCQMNFIKFPDISWSVMYWDSTPLRRKKPTCQAFFVRFDDTLHLLLSSWWIQLFRLSMCIAVHQGGIFLFQVLHIVFRASLKIDFSLSFVREILYRTFGESAAYKPVPIFLFPFPISNRMACYQWKDSRFSLQMSEIVTLNVKNKHL